MITNLDWGISLLKLCKELDTTEIRSQMRDIALQLDCEQPDTAALRYLTRKLHLTIRSTVDLSAPAYLLISENLSQLIGAVSYLPARIPAYWRVGLPGTMAMLGSGKRPRTVSTPARPAATMAPPTRAWMALRAALKTRTTLDNAAVSKIMHAFSEAAKKPGAERVAALDLAQEALQAALRGCAPVSKKDLRAVAEVLKDYYHAVLPKARTATEHSPADRSKTGAGAQASAISIVHTGDLGQAQIVRSLRDDFAAVASGLNPLSGEPQPGTSIEEATTKQ